MKEYYLIIFLISLIFISACGEESSTNDQSNTNTQPSSSNTNIKIYKIGDKFTLNKITYTVNKVDKLDFIGNEFLNKQPDGIFYIISLTVENTDNKAREYFSPEFKIVDSKNREFTDDREATLYLKTSGYEPIFFEQLQPSLPKQGAVAFDLPTDANGLKLKIKDGMFSSEEVIIDLDL